MSTSRIGPPAFTRHVVAYLRHYRALGQRYRGVEHILSQLGRYLTKSGAADLDGPSYEGWRRSRAALHSNSRRQAEQNVRRFCLYRRRREPTFFVPSVDDFSRLRPYVRPVIIEPDQVALMLR
jgi:integrase/recombinase XerD